MRKCRDNRGTEHTDRQYKKGKHLKTVKKKVPVAERFKIYFNRKKREKLKTFQMLLRIEVVKKFYKSLSKRNIKRTTSTKSIDWQNDKKNFYNILVKNH